MLGELGRIQSIAIIEPYNIAFRRFVVMCERFVVEGIFLVIQPATLLIIQAELLIKCTNNLEAVL